MRAPAPAPPRGGSRRASERLPALTSFRDLGVLPLIADALEAVGIVDAFPIQEMTLPVALAGNDIIGQAKTGTGKTLAFGIPIVQQVLAPEDEGFAELPDPGKPQALVVVPTRELAVQVAKDLEAAGGRRGVRVAQVYGGRAYEPQVEMLRKGVEVVVGTPGRLLDLAKQGTLELGHVRMLVLDEADEMLDLGFLPDVERILSRIPDGRQTLLYSATMPSAVVALARQYLTQPVRVNATNPDDADATVANTEQHVFQAHQLDKPELLARVLQARGRGLVIVFCRTKRTAARVAEDLTERGFAAAAVHGDLGQGQREQALRAFRNGKVDILVATDVAARGIDVEGVTHVVNHECPEDEKTYLHRIGRTGRAGASGVAITLVDWADITRWQVINKALGLSFYTPVETYSTSEHLLSLLDIPADAKGVLPRAERTRAGLDAEEVEDLGETGQRRPRTTGGSSGGGTEGDGSRSRRRRGGSGSSGSGASTEGSAAEAAPATEERAPRSRSRSRRRTRSGQPVAGAPAEAEQTPGA
ncbi:DEAD/DEAH box helicase [Motilibacter rhizosphaerae]|uniref:DEAD/DEAH box helicase n=1 Tax=Motilibacter rhizosphaerae TaxID=598652 RepID=UPI001E47657F|nr:DEAD/DEAH box helicase [Motilibacter rhizosphaerae]